MTVQLTEINSIITDKLEQVRKMSELKSSEQDKLSSIEGRLEKLSQRFNKVASGLADTNGRLAIVVESSRWKPGGSARLGCVPVLFTTSIFAPLPSAAEDAADAAGSVCEDELNTSSHHRVCKDELNSSSHHRRCEVCA